MKLRLINVLAVCLLVCQASFAAETPADVVKIALDGLAKGDVQPLISRLSDLDRRNQTGGYSEVELESIKAQLNIEPAQTIGWQEYEYRVAADLIRNYGVVKKQKDAALERAFQMAFIKDQWIKGEYAEVDLIFPYDAYKYSVPLIRFVLYKEAGSWKISWFGTTFVTFSITIRPMTALLPFVAGDYTDFILTYVYGDDFLKKQKGRAQITKFSMLRRLREFYSGMAAKAKGYLEKWATTGDPAGMKKYSGQQGGADPTAGHLPLGLSHDRSANNPYLAMPMEGQLGMLAKAFLSRELVLANFVKKAAGDVKLRTKAQMLLGEAYVSAKQYAKAVETYESIAANTNGPEVVTAKKALVPLYLKELKEPQKAEAYMEELGKAGQLPRYDMPRSKAPHKMIFRESTEPLTLVDFEIGVDRQTLYGLFQKGHYSDKPKWVETQVVEYRVDGSSQVLSVEKNDVLDTSPYRNLAVAKDGLWIYGSTGHAFKIDYKGNFLTYVSDAGTRLQFSKRSQDLRPVYISWWGMSCEGGKIFITSNMGGNAFEVRGFDESSGELLESVKLEKPMSAEWGYSELRKSAEKILIPSPRSGEVFFYNIKRERWKYIDDEEKGPSLNMATNMCADLEGNLYVALGASKKLFVFSKDAKELRVYGIPGIIPEHVGVDGKGNIYLAGATDAGDMIGVVILDRAAKVKGNFDIEKIDSKYTQSFINRMVVTAKGTIFLNIGKTVRRYDSKGKELDRWERRIDGNIQMAPDNVADSVYIVAGIRTFRYKGPDTVELPRLGASSTYMAEMSGDDKGIVHGYDFNAVIFSVDPQKGVPEFKAANAKNMEFISKKMIVDAKNNIWIINGLVLRKLDEDGKEVVNIRIPEKKIWAPVSVDSDSVWNFYLADNANKKILTYGQGGKLVASADVSQYVDNIQKIRVDRNGNLYLLETTGIDSKKEVIYKFENFLEYNKMKDRGVNN